MIRAMKIGAALHMKICKMQLENVRQSIMPANLHGRTHFFGAMRNEKGNNDDC